MYVVHLKQYRRKLADRVFQFMDIGRLTDKAGYVVGHGCPAASFVVKVRGYLINHLHNSIML